MKPLKPIVSILNKINLFIFLCLFLVSCVKDVPTTTGGGSTPTPSALTETKMYNVSYNNADTLQRMDIVLPAGRTSATKVVFLIHGGGWKEGDKRDISDIDSLFRQKWPEVAMVNLNYRLTSNPTIHGTEIMNDISTAVNYIKANKTNFAISDTFFMLGQSAGAHLALVYTYKYNTDNNVRAVSDFYGPTKMDDWEWYNSIFWWNGVHVADLLTAYNNAPFNATLYALNSPLSIVTAQNAKPTIIFHGSFDAVVPLYQSQWMNNRLNALSVPNEYYEFFGLNHGFDYNKNAECVDKSIAFFKAHTIH